MRLALGALAAVLIGGVAGAAPREPSREQCYLVEQADGGRSVSAFPSLRLIRGDASAPLPPLPTGQYISVDCSRNSLVPAVGDYRVLKQYELPLTITSKGRVGVLEIAQRRLRFRLLQGQMSADEHQAGQERLSGFQPKFAATP